ncbi:hypothetical protein [Aliivibrio fischeri]|uniref:hypothetical protein n=1 Tax=Aliivibrio fischeri TaxID=668 RepID=UPI0012D970BD|nr:hypothetical protein [Aliivibrio fischeri]MUK26207.1 hypothetical protein [Aliivibrio fischeri]MUK33828.1 hypothetical protein [Aliivibrio fischeri]
MAKKKFHIPICVDNLAQFYSFGFITPASLFPFNNYLPDQLSLFPSTIPMYLKSNGKDKIPSKGVRLSKEEDENLKTAVVVVSSIEDSLLEYNDSSSWFQLDGILPTYLISEIYFEDKEAKEHFDYLTRVSGRVSKQLLDIKLIVKPTEFSKLFSLEDPDILEVGVITNNTTFDQDKVTRAKDSLRKMSAYGASLALTYVMTKNSQKAHEAFEQLSRLGKESSGNSLKIISWSEEYFGNSLDINELDQLILKEFFDALISCDQQDKVLDRLIPFFDSDLGSGLDSVSASKYLNSIKQYAIDIQKGKIDGTNSQKMAEFACVEKVSQFIKQIVTIFALLNETEKLFTQPITSITAEGYLNIAVSYGLRDKFYELPKDVRGIHGLETYVIERMYEYYLHINKMEHAKSKSKYKKLTTLIDILSDSKTPDIGHRLYEKFALISKDITQNVNVNGVQYVPANLSEAVEKILPNSDLFSNKMITYKAFEDVDFNAILSAYEAEKEHVKHCKKFSSIINQL